MCKAAQYFYWMSNESFILSLTSQRNEKVVFITSILAYCKKKKKKKAHETEGSARNLR